MTRRCRRRALDEAQRRGDLRGLDDLLQRDAARCQPLRIHLNLQLAVRKPQMATFATPGTPSRRGWIVQRAITDFSIGETSSERART